MKCQILFSVENKNISLSSELAHRVIKVNPLPYLIPLKRQFCLCLHSAEGCSGVEKVLCILRHRGVQLILAYSWARPAILVAGKGIGVDVFISSVSSLSFLFLFLPCPSLFNLLYYLFSLFSPSLWETTQNDPQGLTCRMHKPQHNKKTVPLIQEGQLSVSGERLYTIMNNHLED